MGPGEATAAAESVDRGVATRARENADLYRVTSCDHCHLFRWVTGQRDLLTSAMQCWFEEY